MFQSSFLIARLNSNHISHLELNAWFRLFRHRQELMACISENSWWFRAEFATSDFAIQTLSAIPNAELFHVDELNRLIPVGSSVPVDLLRSDLKWQALSDLSRLWLPASNETFCDELPLASIALRWEYSKEVQSPNALLCQFDDWRHFVTKKIKQKWEHLQFARCYPKSNDSIQSSESLRCIHDTLILGTPVPPIPGIRMKEYSRVLLPVEMSWQPAVSVTSLHRAWSMPDQTWALWLAPHQVDFLSDSDFCRASRTAIVATNGQSVPI
ncbi:MAG: hypothetical protein MUC83_11015 [Pirellula sp.]|nr:hypothetical protein [Pirellula sp.]